MKIYRVENDANRYCAFRAQRRDLFHSIFQELCQGRSIASLWEPGDVDIIPGRKGDFVGGPTIFARIAMGTTAHDAIGSFLQAFAELLPFTYGGDQYWAIYLPNAYNCLDYQESEFWGKNRNPSQIKRIVFLKDRIPPDPLFRIQGAFDYYAKEEFNTLIEKLGLNGLKFREVWSDQAAEHAGSGGWDHQAMTNKQRQLFKELADSGRPNTLKEHSRIAVEALEAGGATRAEARKIVADSLRNLREQGVRIPTNIPWN